MEVLTFTLTLCVPRLFRATAKIHFILLEKIRILRSRARRQDWQRRVFSLDSRISLETRVTHSIARTTDYQKMCFSSNSNKHESAPQETFDNFWNSALNRWVINKLLKLIILHLRLLYPSRLYRPTIIKRNIRSSLLSWTKKISYQAHFGVLVSYPDR